MTQDVRPWLTEIKSLQQKLDALQQERDEAYASAAKWRSLYEIEAQQRRNDASLAQQTIDALQAEIQQMREFPATGIDADAVSVIQQEIKQMVGVEDLQVALVRALTECDRLVNTLKAEQTAHSQTRKSLTTALGDTVDLLSKERTARKQSSRQVKANQTNSPESHKPLESHKPPILSVVPTTTPAATPPTTAIHIAPDISTHQVGIKTPSLELPQLD